MTARLVHAEHVFINFANRTYQWVDIQRFRLRAFHDWGGVHNEFHEAVLLDRTSRTLTLVVAADD
jgi:hypothetical protein